jgi:hypothetical protein
MLERNQETGNTGDQYSLTNISMEFKTQSQHYPIWKFVFIDIYVNSVLSAL